MSVALPALVVALLLAGVPAAAGGAQDRTSPPGRALVGAYYSDWYPVNAQQGTMRQHLVPERPNPALASSADPRVAEASIAEAHRFGVNFFALDWWPRRPGQNRHVDAFLRARNVSQIKFCIFFETEDLGFDAPAEATPVDLGAVLKFDQDILGIARRYFANPSYLHIQGRPVVILYLTRTLTGDVAGLINGARRLLEDQGFADPFFIADEIFWRVTPETTFPGQPALTQQPQVARIKLFDAITAYNLYAGGGPPDPLSPQADFSGYAGQTNVVADELRLYRRYEAATSGTVPVIPDVTPGVNTRGDLLEQNRPAEPRQWLPGEGPGSTLGHYTDQIAAPLLDPRLPVVMVTSWNEWNEDTGIEPVGGRPTTHDDSVTGTAYTQGYVYGGESTTALQAVRNFTSVAWGRVIVDGEPAVRLAVQAFSRGDLVSETHTDAGGWYLLPRTAATTGTITIEAGENLADVRTSPTLAQQVNLFTP